MEKTEKIIKREWMEIGFQAHFFFISIVVNIFFTILSIYIINNISKNEGGPILRLFGIIALVYLVFLYFYPSVVAFDFIQQYKEKNIPTLKHPNRWIIFFLNIFLGVTVIVWLFIYVWAHIPGNVMVEIETFEKISAKHGTASSENHSFKGINESGTIISSDRNSLEDRLLKLNELKEKGLITVDEFSTKKEEILNDM